jgi:hypothetical protein
LKNLINILIIEEDDDSCGLLFFLFLNISNDLIIEKILDTLILLKINLNAIDYENNNILLFLIDKQKPYHIKKLIKSGINVNEVKELNYINMNNNYINQLINNENNRTIKVHALYCAFFNLFYNLNENSFLIIKILLENGADPNLNPNVLSFLIHGYIKKIMCVKNLNHLIYVYALKILLQYNVDVNYIENNTLSSPLILCIKADVDEKFITKIIEDKNTDLNLYYSDNNTPLINAIILKKNNIVKLLLNDLKRININFIDSQGFTALDVAISLANYECTELLLKCNAKFDINRYKINKKNKKQLRCIELLESHLKTINSDITNQAEKELYELLDKEKEIVKKSKKSNKSIKMICFFFLLF